MTLPKISAALPLALLVSTTLLSTGTTASYLDRKPATKATAERQQQYRENMPHDGGRDEKWVHQGFIATAADPITRNAAGEVVYDPTASQFLYEGDAPDTVNPGLWRQHQLLGVHGLFQIADNVWQVRGIDCTNSTFIKGETGWVVIDPGMTAESAAKVRALVDEHLGKRPVSAIIYSHSHVDHFGGIKGILGDQKELPPIYAPEHFLEEASSEWVMAGNAMTRRSLPQWALGMPQDAMGFVGTGLSNFVPIGTISLIPPSETIRKTGEKHTIDGVTLEFQMVPETEAPAEMNIYLPSEKVLFIAEFATSTMHNIQTPRGAKARDARSWAHFLTESIDLFGDRSDAVIFGHTWPRFGGEDVRQFLTVQRDNYKFIHDQTVRLMNLGLTATEVAEQLAPPEGISNEWSSHGFYGTYKHNAKGVFQYYIGWWDGNPAHLDALPPAEEARLYLDAMGGAENVMSIARRFFDKGQYRQAVTLLNNAVFAEPDNTPARELLADNYEQLGYQAESAVWRNIYLSSAAELRGKPGFSDWLASPDLINGISPASFMDLLSTKLNPDIIGDESLTLAIKFNDKGETAYVEINHAVLVARIGEAPANTDIRIAANQGVLLAFFLADLPMEKANVLGLTAEGDLDRLSLLQRAIEKPDLNFNLLTP